MENSIDIRELPEMLLDVFATPASIVYEKARTDGPLSQPEIIIADGPCDLLLEIKDNGDGFWRGRDFSIFASKEAREKQEDFIFRIRTSGETLKYLKEEDGRSVWAYQDRVFWDMRWPCLREMGRSDTDDRILEFLCSIQIFALRLLRSPVFRLEKYTLDKAQMENPNRVPYTAE